MCLQRWSFCNFAVLGSEHVNHSWKRYFLRRCHLEMKMTKGQSGGYTCKSLRGHTGILSLSGTSFACLHHVCHLVFLNMDVVHAGRVVGLVYLQGNSAELPHLWNSSATVCSASADGTVRAWNIQNVSATPSAYHLVFSV